ncbi:MAG: trypsin-like serine protease [Deltaproteobacteria bacterium]|nr:trypsin-like serine protease [Deltaproteobacteria bacterium]
MSRRCSLLALMLFGCADSMSSTNEPILNPDSNTVPPSVVPITIKGVNLAQEGIVSCSGVVVDPHWVLTSAHCWAHVAFPPTSIRAGNHLVEVADVHFHPDAWPDHAETWQSARPANVLAAHDLALVRVAQPFQDVARLYHPPQPDDVSLSGHTIKLAGFGTGAKTGHGVATSNAVSPGGPMIRVTVSPSATQCGDSGGPGFVTIGGGLPASVPFLKGCGPIPGGNGQEAVVGINQSLDSVGEGDPCAVGSEAPTSVMSNLTPVYLPANLDWIVGFLGDLDRDGVCDATDNCKWVPNNQDNCNFVAETTPTWESNGQQLGDACDPTPCPMPSLRMTDFVPQSSSFSGNGDVIIAYIHGKAIADEIEIEPILGVDATNASTKAMFCLCRNSDGTAVDDPEACTGAPFFCTRDPRHLTHVETGGGGAPGPKQTYWHRITTYAGAEPPTLGAWTELAYPGPKQAMATWDYPADHAAWEKKGWVPPLDEDHAFGATLDLVGSLWAHAESKLGWAEHGYPSPGNCIPVDWGTDVEPPVCSVSDAFVDGVGPERRWTQVRVHRLPTFKPAPWWTYCAKCGDLAKLPGEDLINPPFLTIDDATRSVIVWSTHGGTVANGALSRALFDTLVDGERHWIGASEPAAIALRDDSPRALLLSRDGTALLGELARTGRGFDLRAREVRAEMKQRTGFAAAYSRTADALFVAGGTALAAPGGVLADVWTYRDGVWTSVDLDRRHAPVHALAAVFSHRDLRMWIVDQRDGARRLLRLDPATGTIDTDIALDVLDRLEEPYLATFEDGQVVLAGTTDGHVYVGLLGRGDDGEVGVRAHYVTEGKLAMAPAIAHGNLSLPLEISRRGDARIVPVTISAADLR